MPGWSLDLARDDPLTGRPWDLSKHFMRERVRQLVRETKPFIVIGSPPCTLFCQLQNLSRHKRDPAVLAKRLEDAKQHLRFCLEIYNVQTQAGRHARQLCETAAAARGDRMMRTGVSFRPRGISLDFAI